MSVDFFDTMDAIKKHVVKSVYRTKPSHANKQLSKWKKCENNEEMEQAIGLGSRAFDVVEDDDGIELIMTCSGVDDYDVTLNIEVAYPSIDGIKAIAFGDYTKIKGELLGSTNIELHGFNFGFFRFEEPLIEDDDEDEYKIMTIPLICRISVGLESVIEAWQDGSLGIAVQDT